jgi:hypothetical protein
MRTRSKAARYVEGLMNRDIEIPKCAWHFGKVEVRMMMDFIYGGPPTKPEEEVFETLRLRNAKVGKWQT